MCVDHTHMLTHSHRHCAFHSLWLVNYHLSPRSCNYDPGTVRAHPPPSLPLSLPCCLFSLQMSASLLCPSICLHLSVGSLATVLYLECDLIFFVTDYTFALESLSISSPTYTVYVCCHHLSTVSLLFSIIDSNVHVVVQLLFLFNNTVST